MIERLFTQDLEILPFTEDAVDGYNDPQPAFGDAVEVRGYIEQRTDLSTDEETRDRETAVSLWRLFLPAGTVVGHRDRIEYDGQVFAVHGTVNEVWNPRTRRVHHLELDLQLIEDLIEAGS